MRLALAVLCLVCIAISPAWLQGPDPDLNNDGTVTGQDVKIVATCLGKNGPSNPNCDFALADTDGDGDVDRDDLRFVVNSLGESGFPTGSNIVPEADAGSDQTVLVGDTVSLNGSASSDADGDALTFSWSFFSRPAGSVAAFSDTGAVNPSFVVDFAGTYEIDLIVNDGTDDSAPDGVTITTENSAPVADAGPDQPVFVTDTVTLDGSGSSDVDLDPLMFSWTLDAPDGSTAVLSDVTAVMPTFDVDLPGSYAATLVVNDGTVDSATDVVIITTQNSAPVADAGPDDSVNLGATVQLDGSGSSDADGDMLTFQWSLTSFPAGSAAALSDPTAVNSNFVADLEGTYVAQLIVNDGTVDSAPDTVTVVASLSVGADCADVQNGIFRSTPPPLDLTNCDLTGVDLSGAILTNVDLSGANLAGADLTGALLNCLDIFDRTTCANLSGVDLSGANLTTADLSFANLTGAALTGANLILANLDGADLGCLDPVLRTGCTNLEGVQAHGATFISTNLSGANLFFADLVSTLFNAADLTFANLDFADLSNANFTGADLTGAKMNNALIDGTTIWNNTICPDGTNSHSAGGTCVGHL